MFADIGQSRRLESEKQLLVKNLKFVEHILKLCEKAEHNFKKLWQESVTISAKNVEEHFNEIVYNEIVYRVPIIAL